jgi:hypothetical protein
MTPSHWLISAFIVFQLLSIVIGSTPDPASLPAPIPADRAALTALGATVAPILDAAVGPLQTLNAELWRGTRWARRPVRLYLGATKQYQRWNMFSRPLRQHQYVHLRYYVASGGSHLLRVQRELIYPSHAGGHVRLLKAYSDSFRDKAITLALEAHAQRLKRERTRQALGPAFERAQVELVPVIRPFALRQVALTLAPGERLVRAELWSGVAPMPRPGEVLPSDVLEARQKTLEGYDAVTDLGLIPDTDIPPFGAVSHDADIDWRLLARVTWK